MRLHFDGILMATPQIIDYTVGFSDLTKDGHALEKKAGKISTGPDQKKGKELHEAEQVEDNVDFKAGFPNSQSYRIWIRDIDYNDSS